MGASGAGKSTLIKMMYREETPSSGQVFVLGKDLSRIRRREVPYLRRRIGVVFQDFKLLEEKNAWENVSFALEVTGTPRRNKQESQPGTQPCWPAGQAGCLSSELQGRTAKDSYSQGACEES